MIRVELKVEKIPTKEQIQLFKRENPTVKIRVMKDGKVFIYLNEKGV
jgi:hypothetical protein